ncbi:lipopolysaccharide biosynthesis protein [Bacteroidota bacterium]
MKMVNPEDYKLKGRLKFLAKDSLLYGGAAMLNKGFSLITFPLLTRYLSVEEYGLMNYFFVFIGLAASFFVFGQDSAVARYFYEYRDKSSRRELISQSLLFQLFGLLFLLPLLWIGSNWIVSQMPQSPQTRILLSLALIQIPFRLLFNFSQNLLKWSFRRKQYLIIALGSVLYKLIFIAIATMVLHFELSGIFIGLLISNVIFAAIGLWYIKEWLVIPKKFFFLKRLILFAAPFGVIAVIGTMIPMIERIIVNREFGVEELGLYAVGATLASLMYLLFGAFQTAWGPFSLSIYKSQDAIVTYNWVLKGFVVIACTIVLMLTAIAPFLQKFLASGRYDGASIIVFPLAMGLVIQAVSGITEIGISLSKKSYLNIYGNTVLILVTYFSIWIFIPYLGIFAVALGVMIGKISQAIIQSFLAQKAYKLPWSYRPAIILITITISMGFLSSYFFSISYKIASMMVLLISALIIPIIGWFILFTKYERDKVLIILAPFIKKFRSINIS